MIFIFFHKNNCCAVSLTHPANMKRTYRALFELPDEVVLENEATILGLTSLCSAEVGADKE